MRFLENFVETPIAGAIGWTLLHTLWEGAIVSAVLVAVLLAVRSPRVRYAARLCRHARDAGRIRSYLTLAAAGRSQWCKERASAGALSGQSLVGFWRG